MNLSSHGFAFIKFIELGYSEPSPKVYLDQCGVPVVGYGRAKGISSVSLPITLPASINLLTEDVGRVESWMVMTNFKPMKQNQWDAVVSWAYQCSQDRCRTVDAQNHTDCYLTSYLRAGKFQLASGEFDHWTYMKGKFDKSLISRRTRETTLFLQGTY